mmetsp:Transcript_26010/g.66337  ORF Transcript_26010/g.66337 Transcript_26010/m.66337 type:complete len:382 (-) Transcript_26010:7-1152(-)
MAVRAVVPGGEQQRNAAHTRLLELSVQSLSCGLMPRALVLAIARRENLGHIRIASAAQLLQPLQEWLVLRVVRRDAGEAPKLRLNIARDAGDGLDVEHGLHPGGAARRVADQLGQALAAFDAVAELVPELLQGGSRVALIEEGRDGLLVVGGLALGAADLVQSSQVLGRVVVVADEHIVGLAQSGARAAEPREVRRRRHEVYRGSDVGGKPVAAEGPVHFHTRAVRHLAVGGREHGLGHLHGHGRNHEVAIRARAPGLEAVRAQEGLDGLEVRRVGRCEEVHLLVGEVLAVVGRGRRRDLQQRLGELFEAALPDRKGQLQQVPALRGPGDLPSIRHDLHRWLHRHGPRGDARERGRESECEQPEHHDCKASATLQGSHRGT